MPPYDYLACGPDGLQHSFKDEQILAAALSSVESLPEPASITAKDLERLLDSVLCTRAVDESADDQEWLKEMLSTEDEYVALTQNGQYEALMSRAGVTNTILLALTAQ